MATLVKLNLTAGMDTEIYGEEYYRINGEMEDLRNKRAVVTQAEIMRRETLVKVQAIAKVLRGMDTVQEFDEKLFGMLVERIRVMNLVQVEVYTVGRGRGGRNYLTKYYYDAPSHFIGAIWVTVTFFVKNYPGEH